MSLQSEICYSTHPAAATDYSVPIIVVHAIVLTALFVYCLIMAGYFIRKTSNAREEDSDALAQEARASKVSLPRLWGWFMLIYEGFQLSSFSLITSFSFLSHASSPFSLPFFKVILDVYDIITLQFGDIMTLVIFVFFLIFLLFALYWTVYLDRALHPFINMIVFEMFYIPITRSFMRMLASNYACTHYGQPATFKPYPPMTYFTAISSTSAFSIVIFSLSILGIVILQPLTFQYIAFVRNQRNPAMRMLPRFNVMFYVAKFIMVTVQVLVVSPFVVLPVNIVILTFLLVIHIYLQPCLGFGLAVNNFRTALFFCEAMTAVCALVAEIVPNATEFCVILCIILFIFGLIGGFSLNSLRARKQSLPNFPLTRLLYGFGTETRLKASLCIVEKLKNVSVDLMTPGVSSLLEILQSESTTADQHKTAVDLLVAASAKNPGPPTFARVGACSDLVRLVMRGTLASYSDMDNVLEMISNAAEYDFMDTFQIPKEELLKQIDLVLFMINTDPESPLLKVLIQFTANMMKNRECVHELWGSDRIAQLETAAQKVDCSSIIDSLLETTNTFIQPNRKNDIFTENSTLAQVCSLTVHPEKSVSGHAAFTMLYMILKLRSRTFSQQLKNASLNSPSLINLKHRSNILEKYAEIEKKNQRQAMQSFTLSRSTISSTGRLMSVVDADDDFEEVGIDDVIDGGDVEIPNDIVDPLTVLDEETLMTLGLDAGAQRELTQKFSVEKTALMKHQKDAKKSDIEPELSILNSLMLGGVGYDKQQHVAEDDESDDDKSIASVGSFSSDSDSDDEDRERVGNPIAAPPKMDGYATLGRSTMMRSTMGPEQSGTVGRSVPMLKRQGTFLRPTLSQQTFQPLTTPAAHPTLPDTPMSPVGEEDEGTLPPPPQPKRMMIKRQGTFLRPALSQQGLPPAPADVPMSPSAEEEQQGALPPPQAQPKRMMIRRQGTFLRPALSQSTASTSLLPPHSPPVPSPTRSPGLDQEAAWPSQTLRRTTGGPAHRRQATFLKLPMLQSPAIHSPLPLTPTSPSALAFPRHTFPAAGAPPASTAVPPHTDAVAPSLALPESQSSKDLATGPPSPSITPFSDASEINVDDEIFTHRVQRDLEHEMRIGSIILVRDSASQTLRRATEMEEQRSEFRKGQTGFELDSIFVCSASPLSDLGVSLDVKTSNHPKTVRDAIDKNDGLDEIAQSLWTIKIIAPDEFDEVVFPEEFNIVAGAGQGNTGPKKPNLIISVPSGGDSDDKTKKVSRAFQKQKFQLTQILQLLTARIKDVTDTATLLQKKLPQQMAYIEGAPTIAKELCVLLEHGRLPDSQQKIAMRTFSMIVKVPKIVQVVVEECNFHPSVFRLDLDSGDCFCALVESIEKMIIKRKEEFSTRRNVIVYNIHSAYSRLKNTPQANILESCVATCVNSEVLAFAVIHLFDVSILGASSHWDTTIFDNASPQLLFIIVEKINKLLVQLSSRLCIPKPNDVLNAAHLKELYFANEDEESAEMIKFPKLTPAEEETLLEEVNNQHNLKGQNTLKRSTTGGSNEREISMKSAIEKAIKSMNLLTLLCMHSWRSSLLVSTYQRVSTYISESFARSAFQQLTQLPPNFVWENAVDVVFEENDHDFSYIYKHKSKKNASDDKAMNDATQERSQLKQKEKSDRMERARRIEEDAFIRYNLLMKERSAELQLLIPEDSVVVLTNTRRTLGISQTGSNIPEPAGQAPRQDNQSAILKAISPLVLSKVDAIRNSALLALYSMLSVDEKNKYTKQVADEAEKERKLAAMEDKGGGFRSILNKDDDEELENLKKEGAICEEEERVYVPFLLHSLSQTKLIQWLYTVMVLFSNTSTVTVCMDLLHSLTRLSFTPSVPLSLRHAILSSSFPTPYFLNFISSLTNQDNAECLCILIGLAEDSVLKIVNQTHVPWVLLEGIHTVKRRLMCEALMRLINVNNRFHQHLSWKNEALHQVYPLIRDTTTRDVVLECLSMNKQFLSELGNNNPSDTSM
ncbi:hypothetical protein BLNAU_8767 [Blattamonas nauphoetae]|uniref:Uncharacterized protein n=1 Tax=Blattamonas nauphoetae TaxID=2049346 RepID=A0ABQ9XXN0_9EUKA|nr:hypothetical protein BLNAU_8767 [Blattamonas nauphoetae]